MKIKKIISIGLLLAFVMSLPGNSGLLNTSAQVDPAAEEAFEIEFRDKQERVLEIGNPYDLPRPAEIKRVFSTYCCFSGGLVLKLSNIVVNEQQKNLHSCNHCSNDSESVDWQIPPGIIADRVEQPGAIFNGQMTFVDILGKLTQTVRVDEFAKPIDRVGEVADTTGVQTVVISSSKPEVMVWVGGETNYTQQETSSFTDQIYACVDKNLDQKCDFQSFACADGIDNDGNGKIDFPNDIGCTDRLDNDETDPAHCKDGLDNDGDGAIDLADEGCSSLEDGDERNPICADGLDNDGDGFIDHPDDIGCDSRQDNDEQNPPIDRNVTLNNSKKPQLIIQPPLEIDEVISLSSCSGCTITAVPDPTQFVVGQEAVSIITIHNAAEGTYRYAILAISEQLVEVQELFTRQGRAYSNLK